MYRVLLSVKQDFVFRCETDKRGFKGRGIDFSRGVDISRGVETSRGVDASSEEGRSIFEEGRLIADRNRRGLMEVQREEEKNILDEVF